MPKMIVSIDDVVIKEVQLTKDRTTLGRRPYNDIVIDNLAVSGEHAVILMSGSEVTLEDLNSTNGSYVNGKAQDGLFTLIAQEEKNIRENPVARTTDILKKVFGGK